MKTTLTLLPVVLALALPGRASPPDAGSRWLPIAEGGRKDMTSASLIHADDSGIEISVNVPGVSTGAIVAPDGRQYTALSIPGGGATAEHVGLPNMPFKGFFIEVPYGADITAELIDERIISLGDGFSVYPRQPISLMNEPPPPFVRDAGAYARDAFFPSAPVALGEPSFLRGRRVVFVQVFPLRFNPAQGTLQAYRTLRFRVNFSLQSDVSGEAAKQRLATPQSEKLAAQLLLNFRPALTPRISQPPKRLLQSGAEYLIIVKDGLYLDILPLAEWKYKKGFRTHIATMSDVGTTAAEVKGYIQDAYDNWDIPPQYVLLVGDDQDIPLAEVEFSGSPLKTDHPYACVEGTDYLPDLALGRLPLSLGSECEAVVSKLVQYDRYPVAGNWYEHALIAGYFEDVNPYDNVEDLYFMETLSITYKFLNEHGCGTDAAFCLSYHPPSGVYHFNPGTTVVPPYEHREELNLHHWGVSPYLDPIPQWIVDLWLNCAIPGESISGPINEGTGLVIYYDHGSPLGWENPVFISYDVETLENGEMTPVILSMACKTGAIWWGEGDCFCEVFLKHSGGGCVGIAGGTGNGAAVFADLLIHGTMTSFWGAAYDPTYTTDPYSWRLSDALTYSKIYMKEFMGDTPKTDYFFHWMHWFGEPEMMLRTEAPHTLDVTHTLCVESGQPEDVVVTDGGYPVAGALVAISHASNDDYWRDYTDANGSVTFELAFSEPGWYDLVVSAHNCSPYEGGVYADTELSIVEQPEGQGVVEGGTATFAVEAQGAAPFTYQWRKDGENIVGATEATLVIESVTTADAGAYDVVVTDACESVTSDAATLVVYAIGDFGVSWYSIDGGGVMYHNGGSFSLGGTTGQVDPGIHSGGDFVLSGGFWAPNLCVPPGPADCDADCDVDLDDYELFVECLSGAKEADGYVAPSVECQNVFDLEGDEDVDKEDFLLFQSLFTGSS